MPPTRRNLHAALEASATPPDALAPTQSLARVLQAEGNNLYACQLPASSTAAIRAAGDVRVLAELDARFRNTIFMRRGGYVLVDLAGTDEHKQAGRRIIGQIVNVVRDEKAWRKRPYWPAEFARATYAPADGDSDDDSNVGKLPPSDSESE